MMRSLFVFSALLFCSTCTFGQFKNTFAANGNPTTQIVDASGMKQGNWYYYDAGNQVFRTETYADNVLVGHVYGQTPSTADLMSCHFRQISEMSQATTDFIVNKLQPIGSGELVVGRDGAIHLHFYFDRLKTSIPVNLSAEAARLQIPVSSIIKF